MLVSSGAAGSSAAGTSDTVRALTASAADAGTLAGTSALSTPTGDLASAADRTAIGGAPAALPDVSRGMDRPPLPRQTEREAEQRMEALEDLASRVQARAEVLASRQWTLPLTGYTLSARFGESSYLWSTTHTGLDFAAPEGTPIVSIAAGTVTETAYDGAYGNKTVVQLDGGTEIWYCHQSSQAVSVGDAVAPGETIGTVGSTGNTTGPHLHLEVRPGGRDPVDPFTALVLHGVSP
jgi:murein DD-endopeptidase MepM/ murein hydrolase activator NlpD